MDAETVQMLRTTLAQVLAQPTGPRIRTVLAELGWDEVVTDDPETSISALFEEQGRSLAVTAALDLVILDALEGVLGDQVRDAAVLYPLPAAGDQPTSTIVDASLVALQGVALAGFGEAGTIVIPVTNGEGIGLAVASVPPGLIVAPIGGLDPEAGWVQVTGEVRVDHLVGGAGEAWTQAVARARRAQGHELVGCTGAMLDLAVGHATERHQFGRPIGSFQAVKHRLADVFVLTTAARAALHESWRADDPMVSAIARSLAARAHAEACRQCQQVMGGMGFTSEVPLHRYLRRGGLLDTLLGTGRALRTEIGSRILTERTVPRIPKFA